MTITKYFFTLILTYYLIIIYIFLTPPHLKPKYKYIIIVIYKCTIKHI